MFDINLTKNYKSLAQIARICSENWAWCFAFCQNYLEDFIGNKNKTHLAPKRKRADWSRFNISVIFLSQNGSIFYAKKDTIRDKNKIMKQWGKILKDINQQLQILRDNKYTKFTLRGNIDFCR